MEQDKNSEDRRAFRVAMRMKQSHKLLASMYENIVDREFNLVERDAKLVIMDLRLIIKSIKDDDF